MIRAEALRLSFGRREILQDAVLSVAPGEKVGLLGRNGTGKSCCYRILIGELSPDYASISVHGRHVPHLFRVPGLVNYLPQRPIHPVGVTVARLLRLYDLPAAALCDYFPAFSALLDRPFGRLSGGKRRVLELYLLLCTPTRYTLLDEPFAGLDPLTVEAVQSLITDQQRKGILISDHRVDYLLPLTERNYLLKDLRLQSFSTQEQLTTLGYLPEPSGARGKGGGGDAGAVKAVGRCVTFIAR